MISIVYFVCLILSIGNLLYISHKKNTYVNKYYWTATLIIPVIILGYWLKSTVHSPEAAVIALCFIYFDSTVLLVLVLFATINSLNIELPTYVKTTAYGVTALHLLSIWICKDTTLFYDSVSIKESEYGTSTVMTSGPLKYTHYIFLLLVVGAMLFVFVYGFTRKRNISKRNLLSYVALASFGVSVYFMEMIIDSDFTVLPGLYILGVFLISFSYDHIQSHDLYNLIGAKQSKTGIRGFCAVDLERRLLGYNKQFARMIPEIQNVFIDAKIPDDLIILEALDIFDEKSVYSERINKDDRCYHLVVSSFSMNDSKQDGYLIELSDVTEEQNHLEVVTQYNKLLAADVKEKTEKIQKNQNEIVCGIANVIDNREANMDGHIKRTTKVVEILMDEIQKRGTYCLTSAKVDAIVSSCAMYDLGKISISEEILSKPGKLTEQEYAIVKTHADRSGEIVNNILAAQEDDQLRITAYNIARYHHERWDGKGYPDGLFGDATPVEARIMAVADVYDALVSARCYKDVMSFEEAAHTMSEGMGSQFDPSMRIIFASCRERLEDYYKSLY